MTPQHVISQLLESDSTHTVQNLNLLKKIILTTYLGSLKINGLPPDNKTTLGNYLFDDEQMMFDFTRVGDNKRALFMDWFLKPHQNEKTKVFLRGVTVNEYRGFTAEVALTWWGRIVSWFKGKSLDYWKISDLDLSLKNIAHYQLTGIEMCPGNHGILIGFNQYLVPGTGEKYKDLNDSQQEPLGNTKRVLITDKLVDKLLSIQLQDIKFEALCKNSHPHSIEVGNYPERLDKMYNYRKMQRFMSLKPWYIRMWSWISPWAHEEKPKNYTTKDTQVVPVYKTKKLEIFRFLKSQEILVREKKPDIENIVFCGGGPKVFAHIGVWKALNEAKIYPEKFAGSSAGAIMALMCYLGYTATEIDELFKHFRHEHLVHYDINFNGMSEAHLIKTALDYAIASKLDKIVTQYQLPYPEGKITFATLEEIRQKCPGCGIGRELVVTATNKRQRKTRYFSYLCSPDFEVSEAVKTSASLPVVYRSTLIDGEEYNDGGVLNNFPTEPFFDDHSTLLESEYGNDLKVLAVKFNEGPERKAIDRVMEKVYRENMVLNWFYRVLTGVSDPASGWEQDRLKLRKYACQSVVISVENVPSSFTVEAEPRNQMIGAGYRETLNYLQMRYQKNDLEEYENEELMYTTFSSLGELLSYCCYRGDRYWFETVYQLIDKSNAPNRAELIHQAQELRVLYFDTPPLATSPRKKELTFFGNRPFLTNDVDSENLDNYKTEESDSEQMIQDDSPVYATKSAEGEEAGIATRTQNHKILLAVYPVILKLSVDLLKDKKDKKNFDYARHSFTLDDPFSCLKHFAKIRHETHLLLHVVINLLKQLHNEPSDKLLEVFSQVYNLFHNNKDIYKEEYFSRWDLSYPQCLRVLGLMTQNSQVSPHLLRSLSRRSEPMQTVNSGVFTEDTSYEMDSLSM